MIMDKKGHGRQDLGIIVKLIRRCVDDIVVQKLVRTINHDLQQGRRQYEQ
jgi:hypothetical protein